MVEVKLLCNRHLLGEHGEIHKHRHIFVKGYSVAGRIGQIEPAAMGERHDALAAEMLRRGHRHESPYKQPDLCGYDLAGFVVDRDLSLRELSRRCDACGERIRVGLTSGEN